MPTIKPAQFPTIERDPQPRTPLVTTPPRQKAEKSLPAQATSGTVSPKAPSAVRRPPVGGQDREEKLAHAIEVLRAKSVQFYHPDRTKVTRTAQLGQIIDIKI